MNSSSHQGRAGSKLKFRAIAGCGGNALIRHRFHDRIVGIQGSFSPCPARHTVNFHPGARRTIPVNFLAFRHSQYAQQRLRQEPFILFM
jgi:hypothetical protein